MKFFHVFTMAMALSSTGGLADVTGEWVGKFELKAKVKVSKFELSNLTTVYTISKMIDRNGTVAVESRICDFGFKHRPNLLQLKATPQMIESIEPFSYTFILNPKQGGQGFDVAETEKLAVVMGADLSDPLVDDIPTDKSDPRVNDQDEDGHPGVTLKAKVKAGIIRAKGDLYMAQRFFMQFAGEGSQERITGTVKWDLNQAVLDASSALFRVSPTFETADSGNTFLLKRMDHGMNCNIFKEKEIEW